MFILSDLDIVKFDYISAFCPVLSVLKTVVLLTRFFVPGFFVE